MAQYKTGFEAMTAGVAPTATEGITSFGGTTGLTVTTARAQHGTKSLKVDGPAAGTGYASIAYTYPMTKFELVKGYRFDNISTADKTILIVEDDAGAAALRLIHRGTSHATPGALSIWSAKDAGLRYTTPAALAVNTDYRIGLYAEPGNTGAGKYRLAVFAGDSTTPLHDTGLATANTNGTSTTFGKVRLGKHDTVASDLVMYLDDIQLNTDSDATQTFAPWPLPPLATPAVTLGAKTDAGASGTSGTQVVTWPAVSGAVSYEAWLAQNGTPNQADFTLVQAGVTSPYTFTGLTPGVKAFGIKAKA